MSNCDGEAPLRSAVHILTSMLHTHSLTLAACYIYIPSHTYPWPIRPHSMSVQWWQYVGLWKDFLTKKCPWPYSYFSSPATGLSASRFSLACESAAILLVVVQIRGKHYAEASESIGDSPKLLDTPSVTSAWGRDQTPCGSRFKPPSTNPSGPLLVTRVRHFYIKLKTQSI